QGSTQFTWVVNDTSPPTVNQVPDQTSDEGDPVNLTITATDADPGSFTAVGLPPGLHISPAGLITGTVGLRASLPTASTVTVSATDNGHAGQMTFKWTVNDVTPPVITNPGDQTSNAATAVSLPIIAVDADAFTAQNLPPGLSINNSGLISGTIAAGADA